MEIIFLRTAKVTSRPDGEEHKSKHDSEEDLDQPGEVPPGVVEDVPVLLEGSRRRSRRQYLERHPGS